MSDSHTIQPQFYIERCENCHLHQWCTRHNEAKYIAMADSLKTAIQAAIPGVPVDVNTINISLLGEADVVHQGNQLCKYTPTAHMGELSWRISQSPNPQNTDGHFVNYTKGLGAFECYFMGVRLYSKLQSNVWPSVKLLAAKCKEVYDAYIAGEDIEEYETVAGLPIQQDPVDFGQSQMDVMSSNYATQSMFQSKPKAAAPAGQGKGGWNEVQIEFTQPEEKYIQRGRPVSLGECKFIFDRIWKATLDGCNHDVKESCTDEHIHNRNARFVDDVMISDLFHIVNLASILMNKEEPDDDNTRPFDEFMKHAQRRIVVNEKTNEREEIEYVSTDVVPKILLGIFIGQKDQKRIDAAEFLFKFKNDGENKQLIDHIIDQIWEQYDIDKSNDLDEHETKDFAMMVLDYHEKNLAKKLGREAEEIDMTQVEGIFAECEKNENGRISKEVMSAWVKKFMAKHSNCSHDHKLVLEKIISSKEEKLQNFRDGHE